MEMQTITAWGKPLTIKVFQPGEKVEFNGKWAKVVRMVKAGRDGNELTGHVVMASMDPGAHVGQWECWSNHVDGRINGDPA